LHPGQRIVIGGSPISLAFLAEAVLAVKHRRFKG
jgi:hypothetical protein